MKPTILTVALALSTITAVAADSGEVNRRYDSIVASVNGTPISLLDVILETGFEEKQLAAAHSGQELADHVLRTRMLALRGIIDRKLIYADYEKRRLSVPRQYIEDMLSSLARNLGDGSIAGLRAAADRSGTSMEELRAKAEEKAAVDMMIQGYCLRGIDVTPAEVYARYEKEFKADFATARVELQVMLLNGENKAMTADIKKDLAGQNESIFRSLVALYSSGPNKDDGGGLGWIDEDKLRPDFAQALEPIQPGDIVGPIETADGDYFIRLVDRVTPDATPFDKVSEKIKKSIEAERHQEAVKEYLEELRRDAVIRVFIGDDAAAFKPTAEP